MTLPENRDTINSSRQADLLILTTSVDLILLIIAPAISRARARARVCVCVCVCVSVCVCERARACVGCEIYIIKVSYTNAQQK